MASEIDFVLLDNIMKVLLFISVHIVILKVFADAYDHIKRNEFRYRIIALLFFYLLYTYAIDYPILFNDENFVTHTYTPSFIETYYEKMLFLLFLWTMVYILYVLYVFVMGMYAYVMMKRK